MASASIDRYVPRHDLLRLTAAVNAYHGASIGVQHAPRSSDNPHALRIRSSTRG